MASRRTRLFLVLPLICLLLGFNLTFLPVAHAQEEQTGVPQIGAQSAIVVEYPSGRILYAKNEHERMSPASLTKIMTAILALEYGNIGELVAASPDDLVGESAMGLVSGEQQTMLDLLYGMMLPSGNDAAMALARHLGSTVGANAQAEGADPIGRFSVMMNVRLQQLGLADTHLLNPHGLDAEGHYSTAYDLASLSWYALHIPEFNHIVSQAYYEAPGHALLNTNEMLTRYEGADGIKTGWTDGCGLCLATSASRGGHRLISVVLNAPLWWKDSADILDYGFAKIAIDPTGANDPVLSVSQSGVVSGMLENPAAALPLPAPMAQGGGPAVVAPEVQPEVSGSAAGGNLEASEPMGMPSIAGSASQQGPDLVWALVLFLLAGLGCVLVARGLGPRFRLPLPEGLLPVRSFPTKRSRHEDYPFEPLPVPPVRASLTSSVARRREPNLLLRAEDTHQLHIERAVVLAADGKQGSSISEFLQAIRSGGPLDVGVLAEQYQLCAQAFLALARAQVAVGETASARRTLVHGVLVLPHERVLRVALYRLPPQDA